MIHTDRDRLLLAVGVTLVFHAALFGGLALAGFDFTPYPETSPVTVTLPDYTPRDPDPVEPDPVEPEPVEPEPVEPEPVEPEPDPAEIAPAEPEPADPDPEPAPGSTEAPAEQQIGRDAPPGAIAADNEGLLRDAPSSTERERHRIPDDELFTREELDETGTDESVPWPVEGEDSLPSESTSQPGDQEGDSEPSP
ncbi:MAG: hypothetical protein ACOC7V_06865, partial [Spirochaetota bacterium]